MNPSKKHLWICTFFHSWGEWSEPFDEVWTVWKIDGQWHDEPRHYQARYCKRCGQCEAKRIYS